NAPGEPADVAKKNYPNVSVVAGPIRSLVKVKGVLDAIRVDANLDRGYLGGPVLDGEGKVVGMVRAGDKPDTFTVSPVPRRGGFVKRLDIPFAPPPVPPEKRHDPVELTAGVRPPAGAKGEFTVELLLGDGPEGPRSFPAERIADGQYRLKVVPLAA